MALYLLRHAEAKPSEEDPQRPLSAVGRSQAAKIAKFLKTAGVEVPIFWHSDKLRARQTAELVAAGSSHDAELVERVNLAPNDSIKPARLAVADLETDLMIVGHLPHLNRLLSALVADDKDAEIADWDACALACLVPAEDDPEAWKLRWMVSPAILP